MLIRVLRVLLGLGGVLFALGMVILAMRIGRRTMGLCSRFVMFRCRHVFVFHLNSHVDRKISAILSATSIVAEQSANLVLVEKLCRFHCNLNLDASLWFGLAHHK
jgi:hypothetical protein